jgi:hypothetical protein
MNIDALNILVTIHLGVMGWILITTIKLNRTMGRIEEWITGHDKQDDTRHEENLERFREIFNAISGR